MALAASQTVSAQAYDADGTISSVDFFYGETLIATRTSPPYSFTWNNVVAGGYTLTAVAVDNMGASTTGPS